VDMRLPGPSLVASPIDIGGDTTAAAPTIQGRLRIGVPASSYAVIEGPWICTNHRENGSAAPESLAVINLEANKNCYASFQGWVYQWGAGAR